MIIHTDNTSLYFSNFTAAVDMTDSRALTLLCVCAIKRTIYTHGFIQHASTKKTCMLHICTRVRLVCAGMCVCVCNAAAMSAVVL